MNQKNQKHKIEIFIFLYFILIKNYLVLIVYFILIKNYFIMLYTK